jgi:hypothetical protein
MCSSLLEVITFVVTTCTLICQYKHDNLLREALPSALTW